MPFEPSQYQSAVIDFVKNGQGNAIIEAVAGSGKTMTIVNACNAIPSTNKVLFLAFNKSIAEELQKRVPSHVQASTINSFGYSICRNAVKKYIKIEADKSCTLLRFNVLNVVKGDKVAESWFYTIKSTVKRIVSLLKANYICVPTHKDIESLMETYELSLDNVKAEDMPRFYDNCIATFTLAIKTTQTMDFDDQVFMPSFYNWTLPKFDFVFIDECQDLNKMARELIKRMK